MYILYIAIGPKELISVLTTAVRYFSWFIATVMTHPVYRFVTAIVVVLIFILFRCVLPCLHIMSAKQDTLHAKQLQFADLTQRLSCIENSQEEIIKNQNEILRVLYVLHPDVPDAEVAD